MSTWVKRAAVYAAAFAALWAAYTGQVAPSYNSDDSPETTLAFITLGVQHPPGYPLNTLAGKIFTLVPLGSPQYRANLMSAVFAVLAALAIAAISYRLFLKAGAGGITSAAAAAASAAFYAFSSSAFLQGVIAKGSIYGMNAFITASVFYLAFRAREHRKYLYLSAFAAGLGFGNHWTSMAAVMPGILLYLYIIRKALTSGRVAAAASFFLAGCSVYLFVLIRSTSGPAYSWGEIRSLNDFIWLISRAQYAGAENVHTINHTLGLLKYYAANLSLREYPALLGLLFVPGAVFMTGDKRVRPEAAAMLVSLVSIVVSIALKATPPQNTEWLIKPYLVASYLFSAVFAGFFLERASSIAGSLRAKAAAAAAATLAVLFFAASKPDYGRYFIGYDYTNNLTATAGKGSIVFAEGDMNIGGLLYASLVDKEPVVPVIPVVMLYGWYIEQLRRNYPGAAIFPPPGSDHAAYAAEILEANPGRDFYFTSVYTEAIFGRYRAAPRGVLYRMTAPGEPVVVGDTYMRLYSYRGLAENRIKYDDFTERLVLQNYGSAYYKIADILRDGKRFAQAAGMYRRGILFWPNSGAYINLGLCHYYTGDMTAAERAWEHALSLNPRDATAYANMAFIHAQKGDRDTAMRYVEQALKIDPANATARQMKQGMMNK